MNLKRGQDVVLVVVAVAVVVVSVWVTVDTTRSTPPPPDSSSPMQTADPDEPTFALFVGDSYTAGAGASEGKRWTTVAAEEMGWVEQNVSAGGTGYATALTGDVAQQGCGADRCPSYPELVDAAARQYDPDVVVLAGGRNDLGPADRAAKGVRRVLDDAADRFPDAEILFVTPVWDDDAPPPDFDAMRSAMTRAATAWGAEVIDVGDPLLGHPEWVAEDGVHPNDAGHAALAEAFVKAYRAST